MTLNKLQIDFIKKEALLKLKQVKNLASLADFKKAYLGKRGKLSQLFAALGKLPPQRRSTVGKALNRAKMILNKNFEAKNRELARKARKLFDKETIDVTRPGKKPVQGHLHPLTVVQRECEQIFQSMGFSIVEGPELETEWYNFDALNIPKEHPARDMWDTFWLRTNQKIRNPKPEIQNNFQAPTPKIQKLLLRTHTSPVQIRYMQKHQPPLRIIAPGRVFRHEATDASHEIQFYQLEGLMVDKEISAANFRAIIEEFLKRFFKCSLEIRLRPSYFPFTEPSFEIDARREKGRWLELMGAGMVHSNVFKSAGLASSFSRLHKRRGWQGFAFGVGLDRLAMLKYKINDIRLFYSGDLRVLKQF